MHNTKILFFNLILFDIYLFKIGINANGDKPLSRRLLEDMNIGQLQVIVNDLHCQIESKSTILMKKKTRNIRTLCLRS